MQNIIHLSWMGNQSHIQKVEFTWRLTLFIWYQLKPILVKQLMIILLSNISLQIVILLHLYGLVYSFKFLFNKLSEFYIQ